MYRQWRLLNHLFIIDLLSIVVGLRLHLFLKLHDVFILLNTAIGEDTALFTSNQSVLLALCLIQRFLSFSSTLLHLQGHLGS